MKDADVFIGVSAPNIVSEEMVASMHKGAIVFTMANPTPEIMPDLALHAGALLLVQVEVISLTRLIMFWLSRYF